MKPIFYAVCDRIDEVQKKLEGMGYPKIDIVVEISKKLPARVAGYARYFDSRVQFNEAYFTEHREEMLRETVPHEVVHLYVKRFHPRAKQAHGPEFRRLMRALGCHGSTYHAMKGVAAKNAKTKRRFLYTTESGNILHLTTQKHNKMLKNPNAYICGKTGQKITFTGKVEEFK